MRWLIRLRPVAEFAGVACMILMPMFALASGLVMVFVAFRYIAGGDRASAVVFMLGWAAAYYLVNAVAARMIGRVEPSAWLGIVCALPVNFVVGMTVFGESDNVMILFWIALGSVVFAGIAQWALHLGWKTNDA